VWESEVRLRCTHPSCSPMQPRVNCMLLCPPQMWTSPKSTSESPNFSPVEHVKLNMCAVIDAGWAGSTWRHTWIHKGVCGGGGGG
jgi:hypothetical protein